MYLTKLQTCRDIRSMKRKATKSSHTFVAGSQGCSSEQFHSFCISCITYDDCHSYFNSWCLNNNQKAQYHHVSFLLTLLYSACSFMPCGCIITNCSLWPISRHNPGLNIEEVRNTTETSIRRNGLLVKFECETP